MSKHLNYRRDIDGLRAIAIIPVLLFHAGITGFSGGFIGVDIFFVISGYLITTILLRDISANSFSYRKFWARRARRIPSCFDSRHYNELIAGWFLLAPEDYVELARSAREQAYFAANFFLLGRSGIL